MPKVKITAPAPSRHKQERNIDDPLCGIYRISHSSGKFYIGSSNNVVKRIKHHFSRLSRGVHNNTYLQAVYNKTGVDAFSVSVVELCPESDLLKREQYWIDTLNPDLNLVKIVGPRFNAGRKFSDEHKRKIGEKTKERNNRPEVKAKLIERNKGNTYKKGIPPSELNKQRVREAYAKKRGQPIPDEQRQKMVAGIRRFSAENPGHFVKSGKTKDAIAKSQRVSAIVVENHELCCVAEFYNLTQFCKDNTLSYEQMRKVVSGKLFSHRGWVLCQE